MLIESSTVLGQYIMNIKTNSKGKKKCLAVGRGLFLYIYKCRQFGSLFLYSVVFIALTLVPESTSNMSVSLLSDLTMPGDF